MSKPITTRLFMSGDSQAVRIPESLRLRGSEVSVTQCDDQTGTPESIGEAFDLISRLPAEIDEREDAPPQDRPDL